MCTEDYYVRETNGEGQRRDGKRASRKKDTREEEKRGNQAFKCRPFVRSYELSRCGNREENWMLCSSDPGKSKNSVDPRVPRNGDAGQEAKGGRINERSKFKPYVSCAVNVCGGHL